jgi:cell division protein FtsB
MRKPQFKLRDLVWLILLCAVAAAWFVDHKRQGEATDKMQAQIKALQQEQAKLTKEIKKLMRFTGRTR